VRDGEAAIWTVRKHCLSRLKTKLGAIELHRADVRLKRHQSRDPAGDDDAGTRSRYAIKCRHSEAPKSA
jgi:hypothetical protein